MLSFGKHITQAGDPLQKIHVEQLHKLIREPTAELKELIEQLRIVLNIDTQRYRMLKRDLPYFVCAHFHPSVRISQNFVSTSSFVLDIDHIGEKNLNVQHLTDRLKKDKRIAMIFVSPSGDGLKLLFRFSKPLHDAVKYKLFYKQFCMQFSRKYQLEQVLDGRTNDVTRATFLSYDPHAYYNPLATPIELDEWINFSNELDLLEIETAISKDKKEKIEPLSLDSCDDKVELTHDVLLELRKKLNPRVQKREEKKAFFVPEQVDELLKQIQERIEGSGLGIKEVQAIHYGRKLVFESGLLWAEVNIFYGKRGYSAVKTPKRGSNPELAELCYQTILSIIKP